MSRLLFRLQPRLSLPARALSTRAATLVGSLDQGTSSTRFVLWDQNAHKVASHQIEHTQHYPHQGWCEHDPMEILSAVTTCIDEAVIKAEAAGYAKSQVAAVGITNQRETTVVWDRFTGRPLYNAIVWLDLRTAEIAARLAADGGSERFRQVSGLPVSTYFSGVKLRWLMENVADVAAAVAEGRALFGTIDCWVAWNLTGGVSGGKHVTDVTNASRTMLMELSRCSWHAPSCDELGVPMYMLPQIISSSEIVAPLTCSRLEGVPLAGIAGDQQAAMLGQCAFEVGEAKNTYGTGCFMLMTTGETPVPSRHGLLTTVCYQLGPEQPVVYALEGSVAVAGRGVQWLRDNLGVISDASEMLSLAESVPDTGGVYFVPAFSGLFAPYWRPDARACIVGMTLYSTKAHIARAALEAVALQSREVLDAMRADSGISLATLKVDGGMAVNRLLMQTQADLVQTPVVVPAHIETTALGAAFAAGLATGVWKDTAQLRSLNPAELRYEPLLAPDLCEAKLAEWKDAVQRTLNLARAPQ